MLALLVLTASRIGTSSLILRMIRGVVDVLRYLELGQSLRLELLSLLLLLSCLHLFLHDRKLKFVVLVLTLGCHVFCNFLFLKAPPDLFSLKTQFAEIVFLRCESIFELTLALIRLTKSCFGFLDV